jgi:integrase
MRWSEIDTKAAQRTLPPGRVKNDTAHEVPLGPTTLDILASLPRIGDTFVLTTTGKGPASGYAKGKRRLGRISVDDRQE